MNTGKARRVDYYPDEYIAGVAGVLTAVEQGVYWMLCTLIMSEGGAIEQDDRRLAGLCRMRPSNIRKIVQGLVDSGKILRQNDGKLSQKRAQSEVEKSLNRIQIASENGSKGGRPSRKEQQKQQRSKPNGSEPEKTNHQPPTTNHQPEERKIPPSEGAAAPPGDDPPDGKLSFDAEVYRFAKSFLGKGAGGLVTKLKNHHRGDLSATMATLRVAAEKAVPAEWIGAVLRNDESAEWERREAEIYRGLL